MFTENQIALQTFLENGLVQKSEFAVSIANRKNASAKQLYNVDRLVNEALAKADAKPLFDHVKFFGMFDSALKHKLKYPKISLQFDDGTPLRLAYSSKHNAVFASRNGYGSESYGKIKRDGDIQYYTKDQKVRDAFLAIIQKFAADPAKVAADYGKLTHNCCYCSKGLDTPESLAQGYGPVCAKHYSLPWGKNAAVSKPDLPTVIVETVKTLGASAALDEVMNELLIDGDNYLMQEDHLHLTNTYLK